MDYISVSPIGSCYVTSLIPDFHVIGPVLVFVYGIYLAYRGVSWESAFHSSRVTRVWLSLLWWGDGQMTHMSVYMCSYTAAHAHNPDFANSTSVKYLLVS